MTASPEVRIVEVGPRDGLQNEPRAVSVEHRIALIDALSASGLTSIEAGSFVSPKRVPQMADSGPVLQGITRVPGVSYSVLVPNLIGLEGAIAARATEIALFLSATEGFSERNINCSVATSLERAAAVVDVARTHDLRIRAYVSCVLGCPYEGAVPVAQVVSLAEKLWALGCQEISLGDTIGVGTPWQARDMVRAVASAVPVDRLALHFHDTYGQALANVLASMETGISVVDSAIGGLGGCPYAKGASGNLATEDLLYMLEGLGVRTGVDLDAILDAADTVETVLGIPTRSKLFAARRKPAAA